MPPPSRTRMQMTRAERAPCHPGRPPPIRAHRAMASPGAAAAAARTRSEIEGAERDDGQDGGRGIRRVRARERARAHTLAHLHARTKHRLNIRHALRG